jgi:hypothetical protein
LDNRLDLLAVVAHYLDKRYQPKTVLLSLRNTYWSHNAEELKHRLFETLKDFKISNKVGFFMADNASNNDKALQLLATVIDIKPVQNRLRCTAHIINLVCKAILYGVDADCFEHGFDGELGTSTVSKFEDLLRSRDEEIHLKAWRRKGPLGKLHNSTFHARRTTSRRETFKAKQGEALSEVDGLWQLLLIVNGGIRWNSTI